MLTFTDLTFTDIDGYNYGGAMYFRDVKSLTFSNVDATDFIASTGGSFLYHDNTGSQTWDLTMSVTDGSYNCDSATAFVWATVKTAVLANTYTRGSVFQFTDSSSANDYDFTLSNNVF